MGTKMNQKASTLTGAQREYLREGQYEGDIEAVTERKMRSRLRQRVIQGIKDFDILFHHLNEKDWEQIFAEADSKRKEIADLTPEEYLDTLPEDERLNYFERGPIDEEELQKHFEGFGKIEPDPHKFFEEGNEMTHKMLGDEEGEPDIQAIARYYRNVVTTPYYPREATRDDRFRHAAISAIAFLFLGVDSGADRPDDEPDDTTNSLIIEAINRALEHGGFDVRLSETVFHYTNYHRELEEAKQKLENGEGLNRREIELLDEANALPEDMQFLPDGNGE